MFAAFLVLYHYMKKKILWYQTVIDLHFVSVSHTIGGNPRWKQTTSFLAISPNKKILKSWSKTSISRWCRHSNHRTFRILTQCLNKANPPDSPVFVFLPYVTQGQVHTTQLSAGETASQEKLGESICGGTPVYRNSSNKKLEILENIRILENIK